MRGKLIRNKLNNREKIYGTMIGSMCNPAEARSNTELEIDFVFICTEHQPIDRTEVSAMCQFYALNGISPMVRIAYPCGHLARMALDGGAQGIVVPYIETVEQVKDIVGAVRYRPIKGKLLQEILDGEHKPDQKMESFFDRFNGDSYVIIGIESVEAINNLEKLIGVKGVDGVFLGPHDISCSMGIPEEYDNPEFIDTIVDIIKRCHKKGLPVGAHTNLIDENCKAFLKEGMDIIINANNFAKMKQIMNDDLKQLRDLFGDTYEKDDSGTAEMLSCLK